MSKSLKQFNCERLDIVIKFDEEEFNKDKFVSEIGERFQETGYVARTLSSKNSKVKEHGHFITRLNGKRGKITLEFVGLPHKHKEMPAPYIEDVHKWLSSFLENKVVADVTGYYKFNKQYESEMQLSYPVLLKDSLFNGAEITGHEVTFSAESRIHSARISSDGTTILLHLFARLKANVTEFDYQEILEVFSQYVDVLVKKKTK